MHGESTEIDDAFGHWLAGFADGESSFNISRSYRHECMHTTFTITVRADDRQIIDEIQRRTGLGTIVALRPRGATRAAVRWAVCDKQGCLKLVELFGRFPLRAKKARDFAIWREAVQEWCRLPTRYTGRPGGVSRDWSRLAALRDQLSATRAYDADVATPLLDADVQLLLEAT